MSIVDGINEVPSRSTGFSDCDIGGEASVTATGSPNILPPAEASVEADDGMEKHFILTGLLRIAKPPHLGS